MSLAARPTLFEYAGGEPAFLALATAHHARCLADPDRRFVECFVHAADDAGRPDDRDFRAALLADMEWAIAEVPSYEQPEQVPSSLAIPH
ncbi:MAG: hypothetical protein WCB85_10615 [Candidatus Dormiibacterota bacterium]